MPDAIRQCTAESEGSARRRAGAVLGLAVAAALARAAPAAAVSCEDLATLALPNTVIGAAQPIAAGDYAPVGSAPIKNLPSFCRVHGVVSPVPDSRIGFELWLPQAGWNGKLLMFGNGGYSSAIPYANMGARLGAGYATLGTDTGHTGDDPSFAAGRPEAIVDWGNRAVHESVLKAKAVLGAYFARPARYAYFSGCSTGGHQGFMEAQRYPNDFDGIVAGAPGHNRTHLNAGFLWQYIQSHAPRDDAAQIIPASKLPTITNSALAACRADNGARSGGLPTDEFLNDPLACRFDPATIQCQAGDAADCLTPPQVEALRSMYDGARNPRTGHRIYPGWPRGSEAGWAAYWADPANPRQPARADFWRFWAFDDPDWNWWDFDFDRDMAATDDRLAPVINAMSPDLERFRARGGKMIHYHGLADPVVPPLDSVDYHERVVAARRDVAAREHGASAAGGELAAGARRARRETADFYRLFLAPGMGHCTGGPGPDSFDALAALERWVEEGVAPDRIVATKFQGAGDARSVVFTRPLCPYPRQARYRGDGDPNDAGSFVCAPAGPARDLPTPAPEYLR